MTIPVEIEDASELRKWGMGLEAVIESCAFCKSGTRYWHMRTNNPVCPDCATKHRVSELRNWRKGAAH